MLSPDVFGGTPSSACATKAVVSWSGGKDSAWALYLARKEFDIVALITTIGEDTKRVPMHEVEECLIERQAAAAGIPLWTVPLPLPCPNTEYLARLRPVYRRAIEAGVSHIIFGDLFLSDIRRFREQSLEGTGLTPVFPLWRLPTHALAQTMLDAGLLAILTCVDLERLPIQFAGTEFKPAVLPSAVDPCGENGEFHTFVHDGPMFRHPVPVTVQATRTEGRFAYAQLCPASSL